MEDVLVPPHVYTCTQHSFEKKRDFLHARAVNQNSFNEITCPKRFSAFKCDVGNWKFGCKSPSFGKSYRTRNILITFGSKSPSLVNPTEILHKI